MTALVAYGCPGVAQGADLLFGAAGLGGTELHFLHHLSDDTVAENHGRVAVLERELEGLAYEVVHVLSRCGSEYDGMVVTVSAALHCLEVVSLAGLDGSESRTAAHYVHNHAGQLGAGDVAESLAHEADTGAGGGGHDLLSAAGTAVYHVDG